MPKMMRSNFDVIVIGLGIMGSAALSFLARRGVSTVGVDQFDPPHSLGSSHGETRMLRVAYDTGESYVPLILRSIEGWRDLERRSRQNVFNQTGLIYIGSQNGGLIDRVRRSARVHNLDISDGLTPTSKELRQFAYIPKGSVGILERHGGFIKSDVAWRALIDEAHDAGAVILPNVRVTKIAATESGIEVQAAERTYRARRAIVTAGPWTPELLPMLRPAVTLHRQVLHWYRDETGSYSIRKGFKPFVVENRTGRMIYGFPSLQGYGFKIAEHTKGPIVGKADSLNRAINFGDRTIVNRYLRLMFPQAGDWVDSAVCIYTASKDDHFIIDQYPRNRNIWFMSGDSGHAFKFAPVIGEILGKGVLGMDQVDDIRLFSLFRHLRQAHPVPALS